MLAPEIQKLAEKLKTQHVGAAHFGSDDAVIKVNRLTSKAGAFYEKVRYFVDYKEEHTIRRAAIERIIRRKVMIEGDRRLDRSFLEELVRGGYLPNERVSESTVHDVERIFNRFLLVKDHIGSKLLQNLKIKKRLINLAASEIDFFLNPTPSDDLVAEAFYLTVKDSVRYSGPMTRDEFETQIYIACRRMLLKNDDETLFYALWLRAMPNWPAISTISDLEKTGYDYFAFIEKISSLISNDVRFELQAKLRNYTLYFLVLKEVVDRFGSETERVLNDEQYFKTEVEAILSKKYVKENERVRKSGKRAIVYVFCTKIILALAFEWPYEALVLHMINYLALGINIVFHPLLLFFMTRNIKPLGRKNTEKILAGLQPVLYEGRVKAISIKSSRTGLFTAFVFTLLYGGLMLLSFGIIVWILLALNFNVVSILLFLLFLTFVSYFGLRIRYTAENWRVREEEENSIKMLWNLFTLPIIRMGRWLSIKFQAINVFVFVMDYILEVPFKLILATFDGFLSFLREKREETY